MNHKRIVLLTPGSRISKRMMTPMIWRVRAGPMMTDRQALLRRGELKNKMKKKREETASISSSITSSVCYPLSVLVAKTFIAAACSSPRQYYQICTLSLRAFSVAYTYG